jgi:ABC-type glutathione transport system ATPase component
MPPQKKDPKKGGNQPLTGKEKLGQGSSEQTSADLAADYGWSLALLNSDPDLRKVFRQATTGQNVVAIEKLDLDIAPREVVAIVGQTGCGKSTLFDLMIGLERPSEGSISIRVVQMRARQKQKRARSRTTPGVKRSRQSLPPGHRVSSHGAGSPMVLRTAFSSRSSMR